MSRVLHPYINITGIRSGEFIEGSPGHKQSEGIILQVEGTYPYYPPYLDEFSRSSNANTIYNLKQFNGLNGSEVVAKINSSGYNNVSEYYLNDTDAKIKLIDSPRFAADKAKATAYTLDLLRIISDGRFHSVREVYEKIRPEGKKGRFSLLFRPTNWILSNYESLQLTNQPAWIIDVTTGIINYAIPSSNSNLTNLVTKSGIIISYNGDNPSREQWSQALRSAANLDVNLLSQLDWMSPGLLKSVLQKIIRTRAITVTINDVSYNGGDVLAAVIVILATHPGVYDPRIHRFISGIESLSKRLAVSIYEDSYLGERYERSKDSYLGERYERSEDSYLGERSNNIHLTIMLAVALVAQQVRDYYPSIQLILYWIEVAKQAHLESRFFQYSTQPIDLSSLIQVNNHHQFSHLLLNEIGSFHTDIYLVGWIARQPNYGYNEQLQPLQVMPIYHAIDQHNYPEFIYYLTDQPRERRPQEVITDIWELSSKINTRKQVWIDNNSIKYGQRKYWQQLYPHQCNDSVSGNPYGYNVNINPSSIVGCIGHLDLGDCYGVLVPNDPNTKLIIRKPTRDSKIISDYNQVEYQQRIALMNNRLIQGITITRVPNGLEVLKNAAVGLDGSSGRVILQIGGMRLNLDQPLNYRYQLYHHNIDPDLLSSDEILTLSATFCPKAVFPNYEQKILSNLSKYSRLTHKRLLTYLDNKSTISLNKLTRSGEGEVYLSNMIDVNINLILSYWSVIMPGIFRRSSPNSFNVIIEPLYSQVVKSVRIMIINTRSSSSTELQLPTAYPNIQLHSHQQSALQQLLDRINSGYTKNIIWMTAGLGKTLITIFTILNLLQGDVTSYNRCPKYVIYTLPQSASATVISQYQSYFPIHLPNNVDQIRSSHINFIYHDIIKNWSLGSIIDDCLIIIDEFHLGMGDTLRSRYLVELASNASMSIMMTGTLIRYDSSNYLIQWLNLISDFYLDNHNYWVAVTDVISWLLQTNVKVNIDDIEVPNIAITDQPLHQLLIDTYRIITPIMVNKTFEVLGYVDINRNVRSGNGDNVDINRNVRSGNGDNVFIVAWNSQHQQQIRDMLLTRLRPEQIGLITSSSTLDLNYYDQSPIRVVITTIRQEAGYTLTKMGVMITGIYPSNQATREQLMYRINRIGQHRPEIYIYRYHGGVTSLLLEGYNKTMTVNEMLKTLAHKVRL